MLYNNSFNKFMKKLTSKQRTNSFLDFLDESLLIISIDENYLLNSNLKKSKVRRKKGLKKEYINKLNT